jgi:hypothetical protein
MESNPKQRHNQLTEVRPYCRVFYIEFAIVENFLQVCQLRPALSDLNAQLFLFRIWRNILCRIFNFGTELIRMKHQFGECLGVFIHQGGIVFSRSSGVSLKVSRIRVLRQNQKEALAPNLDLGEYGFLNYNYEEIHLHPSKRRSARGL